MYFQNNKQGDTALMGHTRNKHKEEIPKNTQKCESDGCESTFDTENKLLIRTNNQHSNPPII